jgi:hypothetical protein
MGEIRNDHAYNASLEELVHALHRIQRSPKPPLGSRPAVGVASATVVEHTALPSTVRSTRNYDKSHPERGTTTFFHDQMQNAFPGIRGLRWFDEPEGAGRRLSKLLADLTPWPLDGTNPVPLWWWRGGRSSFIDEFEHLGGGQCVLDSQEFRIHRLGAWRDDAYWRDFVYVETTPLPQAGRLQYDTDTLNWMVERFGYSSEEYAIWRDKILTREEYDDGSVDVDGDVIEHQGAQLRMRYLSPYNFVIAAQFSPLNCDHQADLRLKKLLDGILRGTSSFDELKEAICLLPRYGEGERR